MAADFFAPLPVDVFVRLRSASTGDNRFVTDRGTTDRTDLSRHRSIRVSSPSYSREVYYLGTAVTFPRVAAQMVYRQVDSERVTPGPFNKILCTEQHTVSMILNRLNYKTFNRLKQVGTHGAGGGPPRRDVPAGKWVMGYYDAELFLRYQLDPLRTGIGHIANLFPPTVGGIDLIGKEIQIGANKGLGGAVGGIGAIVRTTTPKSVVVDGAPRGRLYYSATLLSWTEELPNRVQEVGLQFECNPLPKDGQLLLYTEVYNDFLDLGYDNLTPE